MVDFKLDKVSADSEGLGCMGILVLIISGVFSPVILAVLIGWISDSLPDFINWLWYKLF